MGHGLKREHKPMKLVVVDLDGTLIDANSFHVWITFSAQRLLFRGSLLRLTKMVFWVGLRYARIVPHQTMKKYVLRVTSDFTLDTLDLFAKKLKSKINDKTLLEIKPLLESDEYRVILATAAPIHYAERLARLIGITEVIGTNVNTEDPEWFEAIRENKLKALKEAIGDDLFQRVALLLTDHHDDLPLIEISDRVILVKPSDTTISILKEKNVDYFRVIR